MADSLSLVAPFRVVNIGNNKSLKISDFIAHLEKAVGKHAVQNLIGMQAGELPCPWADTTLLKALTGYVLRTEMKRGVKTFVDWYKGYYG